jgi:predicted DsbA family dithiol-disulfide isomerase
MGAERSDRIEKHLVALGTAEGISFNLFDGRISSSLPAHRLLHYTLTESTPNMQTAVANELFSALFEQGKDIGEIQVLVEAAMAAGLDEHETKAHLESGQGEEEVRRENEEVRALGINSVPNFRFTVGDELQVLDGAKDTGEIFELLISMKQNSLAQESARQEST